MKTIKSFTSLQRKNAEKFPIWCQLAEILLIINSSGASIERYYSICDLFSYKIAGNSPDLSIAKCVLSANIHFLVGLNRQ